MATLPSDLVDIPGFMPLQPSDATMTDDDADWEIDELLSQTPDPANHCPQIPYIPEPPEAPPQASRSTWNHNPSGTSSSGH